MYGVDSREPLTQTLSSSPLELAHAKDASLGRNRKSKRLRRGSDDRTLEAVIETEGNDAHEFELVSSSPGASRHCPSAPNEPQAPSPNIQNMQINTVPFSIVRPEVANPPPEPPSSATMEALQTLFGEDLLNSFEQVPSQESPPAQSNSQGIQQYTNELQHNSLENVSEPMRKPRPASALRSRGSSHSVAVTGVARLPTSTSIEESGATAVAAQNKLGRNERIGDLQDGLRQKLAVGCSRETRSASLPFRPRSAASVTSNSASLSRSAMLRTRPCSAPALTVTSTSPPFGERGNARMIYIKAGSSSSNKSKNEHDLTRRLLQIQGIFSEETSDLLQIQDFDSHSAQIKSHEVGQSKAARLPQWILPPDPKPNKRMARARSATYRR